MNAGAPAVVLRRAGPEDEAALRALVCAAYGKWAPLIGREPLPMQADIAAAIRDHVVELAWDGDTLLGALETIPRPDDLLIESIAIAPGHQGRGLGSRLLARAEASARAWCLPLVRLYTNKLFAGNLRFYERHGYAVEREETFRGGTVVHMAKRP